MKVALRCVCLLVVIALSVSVYARDPQHKSTGRKYDKHGKRIEHGKKQYSNKPTNDRDSMKE